MSRRSRAKASETKEEDVTLIILNSSGQQYKLNVSLRQTLNELKTTISKTNELGKIPKTHQRIFYLGREVKSGGRSLEALGVGRDFANFVIHVHNTRPTSSRKQTPKQQPVVDLANDSDDEVCIVTEVDQPPKRRRRA